MVARARRRRPATPWSPATRHGFVLAGLVFAWSVAEGVMAAVTAARTESVALASFGTESAVEAALALTAGTQLWLVRAGRPWGAVTDRWIRFCLASGLGLVGGFAALSAADALRTGVGPAPSQIGLWLVAVSVLVMGLVADDIDRLAACLPVPLVTLLGTMSRLCAYLAIVTFLGLGARWALGWWWTDGGATLIVAGLCLWTAYLLYRRPVVH